MATIQGLILRVPRLLHNKLDFKIAKSRLLHHLKMKLCEFQRPNIFILSRCWTKTHVRQIVNNWARTSWPCCWTSWTTSGIQEQSSKVSTLKIVGELGRTHSRLVYELQGREYSCLNDVWCNPVVLILLAGGRDKLSGYGRDLPPDSYSQEREDR